MDQQFIFNQQKDKIAFIAPASSDASAKLDNLSEQDQINAHEQSLAKLHSLSQFFENHKLSTIIDESIFHPAPLPYFAAPLDVRLKSLQDTLSNDQVKLIAAVRGGYGSSEVAFQCLNSKPSTPKILIGYSDITALHCLFNQCYNFYSIHATTSVKQKPMLDELINVLNGKDMSFDLTPMNDLAKESNMLTGEMFGGNLTLMTHMIGTPLQPITKNKILFLEDVSEKGYSVHRNLVQMKHANLLDDTNALLLGDFSGSDFSLESTLYEFTKQYLSDIPTFRIPHVGHREKNYPIVIGANGSITKNLLTVNSPFLIN